MYAHVTCPNSISRPLLIAAIFLAAATGPESIRAAVVDPLANGPVNPDLFDNRPTVTSETHTTCVPSRRPRQYVRPADFQANFQPPASNSAAQQDLPAPAGAAAAPKDPCGAVPNKPLNQLGINITEPAGKLPNNLAVSCWNEVNSQAAGSAGARCWSVNSFNWEATCFYHNPLYFEEINLERYGYQCGDRCCFWNCGRECCLQPAASAAHFYGSLLALPYCMAVDCPGDCVYTLGHYRPGNCNPWRRHYPPYDPVAVAAEGGVWTGLVFAIP